MFGREQTIFLEPGCKFYVKVGYFTIGCRYCNILRNIITAFDGRTNISVVCMAELTDVGLPIVSVT